MFPPQRSSTTRLPGQLGQLPGQAGREGSGRRAFDDPFLQFHDAQDRDGNLFLRDGDGAIHQRRGQLESVTADLRNGEAVRQGWLSGNGNRLARPYCRRKTGDVLCFDGDDFCVRSQAFHGEGDAGQQAASAHRDDDGIEIWHLLDDFESQRALTRDDGRIVVAVDVGQAAFFTDAVRVGLRFGEILSMQNDGRTEFLAVADLDERRVFRHHDRRGNAKELALIGQGLGVVAGGGRDDAALLLFRRQLREGVARAAFLEAAGALQVLELAENLHARDLAQRNRRLAGRIINRAIDSLPCLFDVFQRDHARVTYTSRRGAAMFCNGTRTMLPLSLPSSSACFA